MAIAFQASSESHTGTTGAASVASFTWNHAFTSTSDGLAVFVYGFNSATDIITSVTAGGINVPLIGSVAASFAADSTTEPGFIEVYFLGSGLPTTTSAIVVNRTNNTVVTYANAITVTGATAETFVTGLGEFNDNQSITSVNINDGGNVGNSLRMMGFYTGAAAPPTANSATTVGPVGLNIDIGAYGAGTYYELTAGSGSRPIGFSATHNDDTAAIYFAISEVTYNLVSATNTQNATSSHDAIFQTHSLIELDCVQDNLSSTGSVEVIPNDINLVSANVSQDSLSENVLISQEHTIIQSNVSQNNLSSSGAISQTHIITQSNVDQTNLSSTGAITLDLPIELVGSNLTQINNSLEQNITQIQVLVGSNSTIQSYIASITNIGLVYDVIEITVTFEILLQISSVSQLSVSQSVAITAEINLTTGTDSQSNLSEAVLITQTHELLKLDSLQVNTTTSNSISQAHVLHGSTVELLNKNFVGEPAGILSAPWVQQGDSNVAVTVTGNLKGNSSGRCIAWYSGPTYTPNQYAEITLKTIDTSGGNHGIGLRIQTDTKGYERGYIFRTGNGGNPYRIDAYNNASNSVALITSSTVFPAVNDRLRFEANGNVLTGYVNGVQILQVTDNSYSSGVPAVYFFFSIFSPVIAESNDFVVGNLGEANTNTTSTTTGAISVTANEINLVASNLSQTNNSDSIIISQNHILTGSNVSQSNTSNTGEITEIHLLSSDNVSQASISNIGTVSQIHIISSDNVSQSASINTVSITQNNILVASNATQSNISSTDSILQTYLLNVNTRTLLYSDNFNRPTETLTTPWVPADNQTGSLTIGTGNTVLGGVSPGIGNVYNAVFDNNQYGRVNFRGVAPSGSGKGAAILLRASPGDSFSGYTIAVFRSTLTDLDYVSIRRCDNVSNFDDVNLDGVLLKSIYIKNFANNTSGNATITAEIVGNTIFAYIDDILVTTVIDSTYTSGAVGIWSDSAVLDDFTAGNIVIDNQLTTSNTGTIIQTHVLTSSNVSQSANINNVSIAQQQNINVDNINQNANINVVSISQAHIIAASNVSQSATTTTNSITQSHVITQANSSQSATSLAVSITQSQVLVQANSSQTNLSSTGAIVQGFVINLTASASNQSNTSNTGSIAQVQILASANVSQSSTSSTNSISQIHVLVSTGVNEQNNSTTNQISQNHVLAHSPASQANNSSANSISQSHILVSLNSTNNQTTTSNSILQIHQLSTQNVSTVNTTTSNNIVQLHNINTATTTQDNSSQSVAITSSGLLTVTANIQNNTSSSNTVTQIHFLSSHANSTLANISSNSITQNQIISVNTNTQSNTTTDSLISQIHQLIAQSAIQINLSSSGVISSILTVGFDNQYNTSSDGIIEQTGYYIRRVKSIRLIPKKYTKSSFRIYGN